MGAKRGVVGESSASFQHRSSFQVQLDTRLEVDAASGKFSRWYHNSSTASFGALVDGLVDDGSIVDVLIARLSTQRQDVDDDR